MNQAERIPQGRPRKPPSGPCTECKREGLELDIIGLCHVCWTEQEAVLARTEAEFACWEDSQ